MNFLHLKIGAIHEITGSSSSWAVNSIHWSTRAISNTVRPINSLRFELRATFICKNIYLTFCYYI